MASVRYRVAAACRRLSSSGSLLPLAIAFAMLSATPGRAVIGTNDLVPAATLLLPYFEVAVDNPQGVTTIIRIRNVDATPAVVHAVVWTDLGVPTVNFNILLDSFQTRKIDLRDLFDEGNLGFPAFGGNCGSLAEQGIAPASIADFQGAHRGRASTDFLSGRCGALIYGDRIARGYITFDSANDCSTSNIVEDSSTYFQNGGVGVANNRNVLWGDYSMIDESQMLAHSEPMVHVEASAEDDLPSGARTFYGQFIGFSSTDDREPLAQTWGVRYVHQLTDIICWRDQPAREPFVCEPAKFAATQSNPPPILSNVVVSVHDHESNSDTYLDSPVPCDSTTRRTTVGSEAFPAFPKTGWIRIDTDGDLPVFQQTQGFVVSHQGFVSVIHRNQTSGGRSLATGGVALDPVLPIAGSLTWPGELP